MAMQRMKLSQFRYDVPEELVAQYPLDNRDDSRLMIINRETGKIVSGETSVEDALKTIDQEGDQILERFAKTSG